MHKRVLNGDLLNVAILVYTLRQGDPGARSADVIAVAGRIGPVRRRDTAGLAILDLKSTERTQEEEVTRSGAR